MFCALTGNNFRHNLRTNHSDLRPVPVQAHCPDIKKAGDTLVWSFDLMVLRVFPDRILQHRAVPNDFAFSTPASVSYDTVEMYAPKYHTETGEWDPWIQLDQSTQIQPTGAPDGQYHYRNDGY